MKKFFLSATLLVFATMETFGQITGGLQIFYNSWIKPAIPIVGGMVFIVASIMNINKVMGESRDYKGFIGGIILYLAVYFAIVGITALLIGGASV